MTRRSNPAPHDTPARMAPAADARAEHPRPSEPSIPEAEVLADLDALEYDAVDQSECP